jgi:hypothetical protein
MQKLHLTVALLFAIAMLLTACADDDAPAPGNPSRWDGLEDFNVEWRLNDLASSTAFAPVGEAKGESTMPEASGLAPSISNPGHLWSHNDKNNQNLLFLLDAQTGQTVARYRLEGIRNRDWEDIEIAEGLNGDNYIFLADFGDNNRVYTSYTIHKFIEPIFEEAHRGLVVDWLPEGHTPIEYVYPEGRKHDAEALLYDLFHDDLYIVTKRDFNSIIYALPGDQDWSEVGEALYVGEFRFTRAVGGNVSLKGDKVLLKTYERILYWERKGQAPLWQTLAEEPVLTPYEPVEPQGEAICFDRQGSGYFTLSEFSNSITPVLYYYPALD